MIDYNEVSAIETQIQSRVRNFKRVSDTQWVYSCDICGDSKKNTRKTRFGIGVKDGKLFCNCFNCGYSATFKSYCQFKHPDVFRSLSEKQFFDNNTLFDVDGIIEKLLDSENMLVKLFFINRFKDELSWVKFLRKKKIKPTKKNFSHLLLLHKKFHFPTTHS